MIPKATKLTIVGLLAALGLAWGGQEAYKTWDERQYLSYSYLKKRQPEFEKQFYAWFPSLEVLSPEWNCEGRSRFYSSASGYSIRFADRVSARLLPSEGVLPHYMFTKQPMANLKADSFWSNFVHPKSDPEVRQDFETEAKSRLERSMDVRCLEVKFSDFPKTNVSANTQDTLVLVFRINHSSELGMVTISRGEEPSNRPRSLGDDAITFPQLPKTVTVKIKMQLLDSQEGHAYAKTYGIDVGRWLNETP